NANEGVAGCSSESTALSDSRSPRRTPNLLPRRAFRGASARCGRSGWSETARQQQPLANDAFDPPHLIGCQNAEQADRTMYRYSDNALTVERSASQKEHLEWC